MSNDNRVVPFGRPAAAPSEVPATIVLEPLNAGVTAQNLPARLYYAGVITRAEAHELDEKAAAFASAVRRHLSKEMNECWPAAPAIEG